MSEPIQEVEIEQAVNEYIERWNKWERKSREIELLGLGMEQKEIWTYALMKFEHLPVEVRSDLLNVYVMMEGTQ